MGKSITNTSSINNKNVRNNNTIVTGDIKSSNIICTNLTATNIINTELQTATSNIATNQSNISTNSSDITDLQNNKQNTIIDTTDIELNRIDINDRSYFQTGGSSDNKTSVRRANSNGRMTLTANDYFFKDENNSTILIKFSDSGTITATSIQADFFSSITSTELDYLDGVISPVQTQIYAKQDAFTAGTGLSFTGTVLNSEVTQAELDAKQDTITAGTGLSFTGSTLNAEVTQSELDAKQDTITSSTSISCADINCNTNQLSGVTTLTCRSIELNNSTTNTTFLDFGQGDFRFRQLYNQAANTFTFTIDDATGENPESKMVITRTEVEIENANLNLNSNDITNGGDGSFSTITLNSSDLQGLIDNKADDFATNSNGLIMDAGAFPIRELRLLYDTTYFNINGSNELSLNKNINECKTTNFNLSSSGNWGSTTSTYPYISGWGSIATPSGSTFLSNASNGIFSVNSNGLYKIVLTVAGENVAVNNRVVLGVYLSIDDADTSFRGTPGEFMLQYLRDNDFGFGSSSEFTVYKTLTTSNTVRFKTRYGEGSDNKNYNDQTDDANLNLYTSFIIEKID